MDEHETMKNQPSHWWWLESHNTRRSPWLQSTLTELNAKTKAILKLIEEDADSFAQRAEMYYKKRPQLVSWVEDFYRTHRSLAERYDQVTGIRQQKTGGSPFSPLKHHQSEKLMNFADDSYDIYSESCDIEESVESEVDDPEQQEEKDTKLDNCTEEEELPFVAANDEVMVPRKEIERLGEENIDQNKKYNIYDEVVMLREEIEQLRKENSVQKDELNQKSIICGEVMMLREEIEQLRKENSVQKDELNQKDVICGEVMMLREKIEELRKESSVQKDELNQKDVICGEVMMLKEEIEVLRKENRVLVDKINQKGNISGEIMMLREEIERLRKENRAQKDELKQKGTISGEVMMLREDIQRVREETMTQKDHLRQKDQEKIQVIRHLSLAIDMLKQENVKMRCFIAKESANKWKNPFEFQKLMGSLSGKLFNGLTRNQPSIVAL
ncbi:hypothetical protein VNO78_20790 [Psophocarpus tetragonolobus]|uniref:NAB domain-containing protein n=1 Tax=Psophocarpus tetragonolobus TaxID=3891 RepID=A0AAN9SBL1_PSOTE